MRTILLTQAPLASARPGTLLLPVSQLEDAGQGTWRSVGHDPYFEIRGPIPAGWYRATWRMGAAFPMPVTFFIQFAAPRRDHLSVRCGDVATTAPGERSHLFRLGHAVRKIQVQPCARPGTFTFADFRWEREDPPEPLALYAKNDLAPNGRGWRSLGGDPVFECLCTRPAGFYRLRWTARAPFRLQFKIYYGSDGNFSEAKVRSISGGPPGMLAEYSVVAHFAEAITHLQLHPCECAGELELDDFRVEPEPPPQPGELHPCHQIERLETGSHRYRSLGVDPAFELHTPLDPGWYDVSWTASATFPLDTRLYFAAQGGGYTELATASWAVSLGADEREFRYRLRLDEPFDRLQLHPTADRTGTFTMRDFRIRKLGRWRNWLADRSARVVSTRNVEERWFADYRPGASRRAAHSRLGGAKRGPLISILMPVFDPNERFLREAIESVRAQTWRQWELCIADDASTRASVRDMLRRYADSDSRIRVVMRERNGHIAEATNSALAMARGDFVAFLDQDDCLHPFALGDVAKVLRGDPRVDVVYTDEDKIDEANRHIHPVFKPDWSPDTLLSKMYVGHFLVARAVLVRRLGGLRAAYSGSQDYDLMLRLAEHTSAIAHVARVRYHWRAHAGSAAGGTEGKEYAFERGRLAIVEALERRGEPATVAHTPACPGNYDVRFTPAGSPLVTIVIPFRDELSLTGACVASIVERTAYRNFEILLVDNGSEPVATAAFRRSWLARDPGIRFMSWDHPFNFAALNNAAAREARGDLLLFLNNDTEVISPDWLGSMAGQATRPGVGAVGAKLVYSNGTVQHAGVLLGVGGVAGHAHRNLDRMEPGYNVTLKTLTNYSAVTAACMMCTRSLFEKVGGFDPQFAIAFNDVDLCLRIMDAGYRNVYVPVELFHHESRSRGFEDSPAKQQRFEEEQRKMLARWGRRIAADPFYNRNLSRLRDDFHYDPLPAHASVPGQVDLDLARRVVLQNGAPRPVLGRCRFDSGVSPARGWFYVDGRERGSITLAGPQLGFELPGDLDEGEHALEVLLLSADGERVAATRPIDVVHARIAEDELGRIAELRRVVPFDLPVQAYVEVTTACNLACVMCRFDVKGKDVPTNLFLRRELFERLEPLFQALRVVHLYGWGEPTLHRDYVDFIRSVRSRNRDCLIVFTSNFNNISEKLMAAFIEDRVDMINVSIDGASAPVYDGIRRHGSFEKLMATLDAFRRKKERYASPFPHLQYEFVVQRGNVHEMVDYVDLIDSLAGRHITFEHVCGMPHLEVDYREWLPTFVRAEARARELGIGISGSAVEAFRAAGARGAHAEAEARARGEVICHEPFQTVYVNPDGTVSPCCMSRVILGDLREQSLEAIWFGRPYNDFRSRMARGDLDAQCRTCVALGKNQGPVAPS